MNRLVEFFQGQGGRLSMARLMMFMAFWPSSAALIIQSMSPHGLSDLLLLAYLTPFAGAYGVNKITARPKEQKDDDVVKPDNQ